MVKVVFKYDGKDDRIVEGDEGSSVMEAALANDIGEILAERVGERSAEEEAMIEMAVDPDERSRLSCQIKLWPGIDGVEIILPASQL
jgi:ferredoxin, 2Fe-2S